MNTIKPFINDPPPAGVIDPAIAAWANDFDLWLESYEGRAWLAEREAEEHERVVKDGSVEKWLQEAIR